MILRTSRLVLPAGALALLAVLGCGSADQSAIPDDRLTVVASTDVWASVVRAVAADTVDVKTIIDDPAGDPHSYESSPADAAEVASADLVVFNGGGYDEFIEQMLARTEDKPTVEAVAVASAQPSATAAGQTPDLPAPEVELPAHGTGANEHVWYDLSVVQAVAEQVAEQLGQLAPEQADQFTAGAKAFQVKIDELRTTVSAIAEGHAGTRVVMTEPVAFYLVEAAGLIDATPAEFTEAVEEETDPPAAAVAATRDLLAQRQVSLLIYNPQTETPVTSQMRTTAESAALPVVQMTETLPAGVDYLGWMSGQIDALSAALG